MGDLMWSKFIPLSYARLPVTVSHYPLEPATSFISRLAARNGILSVRGFCRDIRFPYSALVAGDLEAIKLLAQLGACDPDALAHASIGNVGGNAFRLRDEMATSQSLQRSRIRICPKCVHADVGPTQETWRAWRRVSWQFTSVRSCATHSCELMSLPVEKFTLGGYDFAAQMRLHWLKISQSAPKLCAPSVFENWLTKRIGGIRGQRWIDQLELNVASRACEVLGLRLLEGPCAALSGHDADDWARYADVGFHIMRGGVGAFECALSDMLKDDGVDQRFFSKVYGPLTAWLNGRGLGDEFEPLKSVVRAHIFENFAVRRGVHVLGLPSVGKSGNSQRVYVADLPKWLVYLLLQRGLAREGSDGCLVSEGFVTQIMIAALKREAAERHRISHQQVVENRRLNIVRAETDHVGVGMTADDVVKRLKITKPTVHYLGKNSLLRQLQNDPSQRVGSVSICSDSVAEFEKTYVSIGAFAAQKDLRQGALAIKLKNANIQMLAMPPKYSRIFWRANLKTFCL